MSPSDIWLGFNFSSSDITINERIVNGISKNITREHQRQKGRFAPTLPHNQSLIPFTKAKTAPLSLVLDFSFSQLWYLGFDSIDHIGWEHCPPALFGMERVYSKTIRFFVKSFLCCFLLPLCDTNYTFLSHVFVFCSVRSKLCNLFLIKLLKAEKQHFKNLYLPKEQYWNSQQEKMLCKQAHFEDIVSKHNFLYKGVQIDRAVTGQSLKMLTFGWFQVNLNLWFRNCLKAPFEKWLSLKVGTRGIERVWRKGRGWGEGL